MEKVTSKEIFIIFDNILSEMQENKDYLVELDAKAGDGDLGISMCQGFNGVCKEIEALNAETDEPAKIVLKAAMAMNEYSPSSLGTILCAGMMGGAKAIKGKTELGVEEYKSFVQGVLDGIMKRAGSTRGQKTILDAIGGAIDALEGCAADVTLKQAAEAAAKGAYDGMEKTKEMTAVHGRAAYYQEKSIGNIDGGATVGMLIFKAINNSIN